MPLEIAFPEQLPVSARRDEIAAALAAHQVVVVSGETGSGKTTQLPKIALAMGRGPGARDGGVIGHTQPRRIAASTVARRIADELKTPLGEVVGYKVRFQDRLSKDARVKLMTDGILLAETQSDPLLRAYDTLIVDEAHERSLNIDFLLGHLKQILPRRPDLKVVITSATIDAERFATHFAAADGTPAPVIVVSGRTFPVEIRWRPFEEKRDFDVHDAIAGAVDELWTSGRPKGDVLVFLPGEREIRDAAERLRKHHPPGVEILPLYARLTEQQQQQVFEPHAAPRIVLATNVAETSLTVPGIRYVVDSGLARVKRYSFRSKVEQLPIEPVSQAAANQRAGRCGRVAEGICIRLYDEADFAGRRRYTEPEILRSSLAGVILRMASLGLGRVEDFPFLEAPPRRAIADGWDLLQELGAVDELNALTPIGRELARLPLDPRVGRMIVAARERHVLREVLVVAAALSVQDVRDRPAELQQQADQAHAIFDDEKSEFSGLVRLWQWLDTARGGHGEHRLSHRRYEQALRERFLSPRRVREWRDVHQQLHTVVAEHGWRLNDEPAGYDALHLALLTGLLGNVGVRNEDDEGYLGARGIRFHRHPGVHLSKKPGRWVMAAELVETTRLYARGIATIDPKWIETVGAHLLKTSLAEPHWEKAQGRVVALEKATLYGLVVYAGRRVDFAAVDPAAARELFIRAALVEGDWETRLPFAAANRRTLAQVEELEHKSRRQDVLVDDETLFAYYDERVPADVADAASFERWYRRAAKAEPALLVMTRDDLMRHEAAGVTGQAYPRTMRLGGVDCALAYLHEPGHPRDGITVTVPLYALNAASEARIEWLVPGMVAEKVAALAKTLPQRPRSRLVPLPAYAAGFVERHAFGEGDLVDTLIADVRERTGLEVKRADFRPENVAAHLKPNVRVVDEHGRQIGEGRNLAALKAQLGAQAKNAFHALAALRLPQATVPAGETPASTPAGATAPRSARDERPRGAARAAGPGAAAPAPSPTAPAASAAYTDWTFGELPELLEVKKGGQSLVGFPALVDKGTHVEIEVHDEPEAAAAQHRGGLARLVALRIRDVLKHAPRSIPDLTALGAAYMPLGSAEQLREQIVAVAIDRAFLADPLPTDAASFVARVEAGRGRFGLVLGEVARTAGSVLAEYAAALRKLKDARPPKDVADDLQAQLGRLVPPCFLAETPWPRLAHLPRYLKAIVLRLDKLRADPARDAQRLAELRPLEQRWLRTVAERRGRRDPRLDEFRWWLEELRVSLFAQELKTPQPVSVKRLEKMWSQDIAR